MVVLLTILTLLGEPVPSAEPPVVPTTAEAGYAPHYAKGLMARVAKRRKLDPAPCMVSRPHGPIGAWVWVHGDRTGITLKCLVVDVSHPRDLKRHHRTGRIVELSWEVSRALCGTTKGSTTACPVKVWAVWPSLVARRH
jgi:hypothetical protein